MPGIFISYRRKDVGGHAGHLRETLVRRYGRACVFMDIDSIDIGVPFRERIREALDAADVALVLIGENWAAAQAHDGDGKAQRRIDDESDLVRQEVATALAREDVAVVPVLVEAGDIPADVPEDLAALSSIQACRLRNTEWRADTTRIYRAIDMKDHPWQRRWRAFKGFLRRPITLAAVVGVLALAAAAIVLLGEGDDPTPPPVARNCENLSIEQKVRNQLSAAAGQTEPAVDERVYYGKCGQQAWALAEFKDGEKDVFEESAFQWSVVGGAPDACSRIPDKLLAHWPNNEYC
jgi:TIR domain